MLEAIQARDILSIHLLYSDHEGGQRTISRFQVSPGRDPDQWMLQVVFHWNLDRADPW
jgi:hypothetical protein